MLDKTHMTPLKGEMVRPSFRTPFGFFENMMSEVEGLWQKPQFRQVARVFDKDLTWTPTLDVFEHEGELVVKADLPGLKKEDLRISMEEGALVLQGERKEEKKDEKEGFYVAECSYGSFYRRLPLTFQADATKVKAKFTDGVLEIHLPIPAVEPPVTQEIPVH